MVGLKLIHVSKSGHNSISIIHHWLLYKTSGRMKRIPALGFHLRPLFLSHSQLRSPISCELLWCSFFMTWAHFHLHTRITSMTEWTLIYQVANSSILNFRVKIDTHLQNNHQNGFLTMESAIFNLIHVRFYTKHHNNKHNLCKLGWKMSTDSCGLGDVFPSDVLTFGPKMYTYM